MIYLFYFVIEKMTHHPMQSSTHAYFLDMYLYATHLQVTSVVIEIITINLIAAYDID